MMAMSDVPGDDRPVSLKTKMLGFVLAMVALAGFSAAAGVVGAVLFDPRIDHPVNWQTWAFCALFAAVSVGGLWGLVRLRPWLRDEPLSPATRRTNGLFALSGLLAVPGALALFLATTRPDNPFGIFSNSPITPWIAIAASASWIVSMAVGWWWYFSADEHERDAYDLGSVVGAGFFTVAAPLWWVLSRAGLLPPPDAMILWLLTVVVLSLAWLWRRSG
jgi:hypothetical protein